MTGQQKSLEISLYTLLLPNIRLSLFYQLVFFQLAHVLHFLIVGLIGFGVNIATTKKMNDFHSKTAMHELRSTRPMIKKYKTCAN